MNIGNNTTVIIKYELKDTEGTLLESTEGISGVTYLHGRGLMIPALEEALDGKTPGDSLVVPLTAEEAYGPRNEELVMEVPRGDFEDPETLEIGENIQVHDGETGGVMTVIGISDDNITLDGNHPYSGRDVVFDISILEVRETTSEDLEALHHHHHDCGCDHDHSSGGCCGSDTEKSGGRCCDDEDTEKGSGGSRDCCGSGNGGCCG